MPSLGRPQPSTRFGAPTSSAWCCCFGHRPNSTTTATTEHLGLGGSGDVLRRRLGSCRGCSTNSSKPTTSISTRISQVAMRSWTRGRVSLVGDAGYSPGPAVGGGTSLAVLGAYVLAAELAAAGPDLASGLAAYEAAIRPAVAASTLIGPAILKTVIPNSTAQIWTIAQAMRILPHLPPDPSAAGSPRSPAARRRCLRQFICGIRRAWANDQLTHESGEAIHAACGRFLEPIGDRTIRSRSTYLPTTGHPSIQLSRYWAGLGRSDEPTNLRSSSRSRRGGCRPASSSSTRATPLTVDYERKALTMTVDEPVGQLIGRWSRRTGRG